MLISLHVKNLAIIDEIEVDFREHLNVLTGETGAGKSIIIGSINMALGGKASADMIRTGKEYGLVELVFDMQGEEIKERMEQLALPLEDGQIILSRKIMKSRSICKVNGETVTISILKELAGYLLDIHGQHEHQSLLHKQKHMEILDQYGQQEAGDLLQQLANAYKTYKNAKENYEKNSISMEERNRQLSFMEYERKEIMQAKLKIGEDEELEDTYRRYANAQQIVETLQQVFQITTGGERAVNEEVGRAAKHLSKILSYDSKLEDLSGQLQNIEDLLTDFHFELQAYMEDMEYNETEFRQIEERLDLYHSLQAKYGNTVEDILAYANQLEEKIQQYKEYDIYLDNLKKRLEQKEKEYSKLAHKMTAVRKKNGAILAEAIKGALLDLNFLDVQFEIQVQETEEAGALGMDSVEFLISTNPGEKVRPLGKIASGGELSRIMLAIKSVLAQHDQMETLIFDEIDVGISGRTAQKVSEKMALIAKQHQVICITHLPQIAAMADSHYIIQKAVQDDKTSTSIAQLEEQGSVEEIARILGGAEITDTVLSSAKEMKELAFSLKNRIEA